MSTIDFYNERSEDLFETYESIDPNSLLGDLEDFIPKGRHCLDIGCGSGRDANWLESLGNQVTAIDPSQSLLKLAKNKHGEKIEWLVNSLPHLKGFSPKNKFDLILISAVWMHIPLNLRKASLIRIKEFLAVDGHVIITLRNRNNETQRKFYQTNWRRLKKDFSKAGFLVCYKSTSKDNLKRKGVTWQKIVLKIRNNT